MGPNGVQSLINTLDLRCDRPYSVSLAAFLKKMAIFAIHTILYLDSDNENTIMTIMSIMSIQN